MHQTRLIGTRRQTTADPIVPGASRLALQRRCACGGIAGPDGECAACRARRLSAQRQGTARAEPGFAPPIVQEVLRSGGKPLDDGTRSAMEDRFGHDFGGVRIHDDARAAQSARAVSARAYAIGRDIVFAANQYAPETPEGGTLLAHELTHVVQQGGRQATGPIPIAGPKDPAEAEARRVAAEPALTGARLGRAPLTPPRMARADWGEIWGAVTGVGPYDAWRAKSLADESLRAAQNSGLPGLHNGPADAWRHCHWNCRMAAEIGADQAETVASNHEAQGGGPANENTMDLHNNSQGRACGSGSCDSCCYTHLNSGRLRVIDATGAVVPTTPTPRTPAAPAVGGSSSSY
jgi:hypothetical protein